jgi:hypothetical protein
MRYLGSVTHLIIGLPVWYEGDDDDGFINVSRGEHHCLIALALIAGTLIA